MSVQNLNTQALHETRNEFDAAEGLMYTRRQGQISFTWDRLDRVLSAADRTVFRAMRLQGITELQIADRTYRIEG